MASLDFGSHVSGIDSSGAAFEMTLAEFLKANSDHFEENPDDKEEFLADLECDGVAEVLGGQFDVYTVRLVS